MLFLINPLFLISFCCQKWVELHAALRTEVIGWDRLESPSVNILLMTTLSLDPLYWDMDCLLTLWPLLIPCSLGNGCCTFGFLIFIILKRNFLYNSLYILTERSLKHLCSIRAWVPVSFFLSFFLSLSLSLPPTLWFSLSLSYRQLRTARSQSIKGPQQLPRRCSGKESPASTGDTRDSHSIPGSGRSPEVGKGNPLQYSCLKNSMDGGAWWSMVNGVAELDTPERAHTHTRLL